MQQKKSKSNFQTIYAELKEDILSGKIPAGSMLNPEKELADKMEVSRPTISKVYNNLQAERLVQKKPGFGTSVIYKNNDQRPRFGLLLPGSGESEIFSTINDQFLSLSKKRHFDCLWEGTIANNAGVRKDMTLKICRSYIEKNLSGIFFAPLERTADNDQLNGEICQVIEKSGIPLILIDRDISPFYRRSKYDLVSIDNFHAGYTMARHLIESGSENIIFFYRSGSAYSIGLRVEGARSAASSSGITFDESHIHIGDPANITGIEKLKSLPPKTGILCGNDSTGAILISSLEQLGHQVSKDLIIAGFDNMKYDEHLKHPLTSFQQPCEEIVQGAINLMYSKLTNGITSSQTINFYGRIVKRISTTFIE